MTEVESVEAYIAGKNPGAVELFRRFEQILENCGPSEVSQRSSIVYWKRSRVFVGAFVQGRRLELNVDLLREAPHPCLLMAFPHTKRVFTHRLRITEAEQLDPSLAALVKEAYDEVGPGMRGSPPVSEARS